MISMDTSNKSQLDLTYKDTPPTKVEYTFFSSAHGTVSRTDHMLGHKTSLTKFMKTAIIQNIFYDYNGMKLEKN